MKKTDDDTLNEPDTALCRSCRERYDWVESAHMAQEIPADLRGRYFLWCAACARAGWTAYEAGLTGAWLDAEDFASSMIAAEFYAAERSRA